MIRTEFLIGLVSLISAVSALRYPAYSIPRRNGLRIAWCFAVSCFVLWLWKVLDG